MRRVGYRSGRMLLELVRRLERNDGWEDEGVSKVDLFHWLEYMHGEGSRLYVWREYSDSAFYIPT